MKKIIFGIVLPMLLWGYVFAQEVSVESVIREVTVYPDAALITRSAALKLSKGFHKFMFPGIIPEVDENSLRVSGQGSAGVKIQGAQIKREYLPDEAAQRRKELTDQIQQLEDQKRRLEDTRKALGEEKQFLNSVLLFSGQQIPKDLVTKMPKSAELTDTLNFLSSKLQDNYTKVVDTEIAIRELIKKIEATRRQLSEISGPADKLKRSIYVEIEVLTPGNFDLDVSYLVRGASWEPIYDARADFDNSSVELISYGIVRQSTGEDWPNVEISLSTAKPTIGGRMPYVNPWFIRPYQPPQLAYDAVKMEKRQMFQGKAFEKDIEEGKAGVELYSLSGVAAEPQYATVEEKGIAVVYKLPNKADIKADGSDHKLSVSSQVLHADFEYSSYPRLAPFAYLGSRVKNAPGLQLLKGRVNVFLAQDFVGASSIDNIGPGEEFDLYLGVDENVKVKREEVERKVDDVLIAGIPAPTRKTTFKYKLTVENYKNKNIKVNLFEAIPVSQDERIKVKSLEVAPEPKDKDWKDRKGVWRWEFDEGPAQKKEIFYSYSVECPRDMRIEGL